MNALILLVIVQEYGPDAADTLSKRLFTEYGVKINSYGKSKLRAVTHYQVLPTDIEVIVNGFHEILGSFGPEPSK